MVPTTPLPFPPPPEKTFWYQEPLVLRIPGWLFGVPDILICDPPPPPPLDPPLFFRAMVTCAYDQRRVTLSLSLSSQHNMQSMTDY